MQKIKKLAIVTTHPVQYYAPLFKVIHERNQIDIRVFYTWGEGSDYKHDPGFGRNIKWDLPLLEGYDYEWAVNTSAKPGTHHFSGIKTPGLIDQITKWTPDGILVFGWAYQSHMQVIHHFKGKIPLYFRGDSNLLDKKGIFKTLLRKVFLSWVYSHIDHFFYVGKNNKEYFRNFGIPANKLSFAPHAIDIARFTEDRTVEASDFRKKLGLQDQDFLILFAGKLEAKKNPKILLYAFLKLKRPNVHLLIVGNGSLEVDLKKKSFGSRTIHFMDFENQTRMPVLYQACDIFCLPSSGPEESWGLVINEAMASGKAIVASDKVGAAVDLIRENINGFIFKCGNADDLKNKLKLLTTDKSILKSYGETSRKMIKAWNFNNISKSIEEIVNS